MTGSGGSGKTRLGREACVQMQLVAAWDAGLADDQRRDGAAATRLERPTLLVVDDADLRTGLISALVEYLRWDDAGPPVRLLLLARAAGPWWDQLVRQQDLAGSYTVLDLDRYPVPPAGRAEHYRCASSAFAAYRGPGTPRGDVPLPAGLDDPAYADPLLIHIAALLRTVDTSATPPPPGPAKERAAEEDSAAGMPVRQALLQALCERERDRWYQLGSHLSFNPDLPVVDQVVALATLTAAGDQPCATSLLAALPNQAEVTRIGAEALVVWAHRLYSGPGYWNPLRPDLLAKRLVADIEKIPPVIRALHHREFLDDVAPFISKVAEVVADVDIASAEELVWPMGTPARDMALAKVAMVAARTDSTQAGQIAFTVTGRPGQAPGQGRWKREAPPPPSMLRPEPGNLLEGPGTRRDRHRCGQSRL